MLEKFSFKSTRNIWIRDEVFFLFFYVYFVFVRHPVHFACQKNGKIDMVPLLILKQNFVYHLLAACYEPLIGIMTFSQ